MNREIKFRGKMLDSNDWVYGFYMLWPKLAFKNKIYCDDINKLIDVNPETVGQFTGLHDKNGKEIYEGDIVKITENILKQKVIRLRPITADIEWSEECLTYTLITTSVKDAFESLADYLDEYDIEVIGNIFENPELLGGKDGI